MRRSPEPPVYRFDIDQRQLTALKVCLDGWIWGMIIVADNGWSSGLREVRSLRLLPKADFD
jgi:hypothetical protein